LVSNCGPSRAASPKVGRFLYAADFGANAIVVYNIDAATGMLTPSVGSPIESETPYDLCFAAGQRFMYAVNFQSDYPLVLGYQLDSSSRAAAAVPGSPFDSQGRGPTSAASDPLGRFLFVGNYYPASTIAAFAIDGTSGALTPVTGSPFPTSVGPSSPVVGPSGRYLYVGNARGLNAPVSVFSIDGTGHLTDVSSSTAARDAWALAVAPSGAYLYMADGGVTVSAFSIDAASGALADGPVSRVSTGGRGGAFSLALSDDGTALFVANAYSGDVSVYSVDTVSGRMTTAPGSPFQTGVTGRTGGGYPSAVAVDPSTSFVYVWNHDTDDISGFRVDPHTRALTLLPGSPFPGGGGNLKVLP
jgi:6-phosphogluconolactonase